ncbi:sugar kinase [Candidatus Bathyarchaeota archaeon]|nr:MAG: sugar kinase [Candidatus Bathyarchaeota archaeon]
MAGLDIVSLGEVMIQLNALTPGPLRSVYLFEKHVAGTEANVMVGLARLGYRTGLITRVGDDEFGIAIKNTLRGEGVDVSRVKVDPEGYTGVYFVQRHYPVPGESTVLYYRRGSAASKMTEDDVDEEYIKSSRVLHITGITPALSRTCRLALDKAYRLASRNGLTISFDTNVRVKLWKKPSEASQTLSTYLKSNIVFTCPADLKILLPGRSFKEAASKVLDMGAEVVVVKLGGRGAYARTKREEAQVPAFKIPYVEDVIGAGDAFDAAFLASYLRGYGLEECLKFGNAAGALVVMVRGDWEAIPTWDTLKTFMESTETEKLLR